MIVISRHTVGKASVAAFIATMALMGQTERAPAQGGIICDYGPSDYKRCCRESYRQKPSMGSRARADDIDACMDRGSRDNSSDDKRDRSDDRRSNDRPDSGRPAASNAIRRLECSTGACESGCGGDEMAISAFCNPGGSPTMYNDGSVRCTVNNNAEWPTVIFCAKK